MAGKPALPSHRIVLDETDFAQLVQGRAIVRQVGSSSVRVRLSVSIRAMLYALADEIGDDPPEAAEFLKR